MAELFRFWNHGVQVTPEYSKAYTNTDNGLYFRRAGWGTLVRQKKGTQNWFHIPLTSASSLDGDGTFVNCVFLKAEINNNAVIKRVHVTMIDQSPNTPGPIGLVSKNVNLTGVSDVFKFSFKKTLGGGAIVLSVLVDFENTHGQIIFRSAGVNLFEI